MNGKKPSGVTGGLWFREQSNSSLDEAILPEFCNHPETNRRSSHMSGCTDGAGHEYSNYKVSGAII